jgi:Mlc titration factor MtfA (ptsG expression regulator)
MLDDAERTELRAMMQVFLEEKQWEGCGGLDLTDEIRVTIAAQACLLQLGLPHDYYRNVESILVYPTTVVPPERQTGVFERVDGPVEAIGPILGQAFAQGPVILVWDAVLRGARHPEQGHNVVYHEFAHKLDMLDGAADGTPQLADREQFDEWVGVCSREFLRLRGLADKGHKTFLDAYGATNEAEFFAVATEEFFDRPLALLKHAPDLYRVLNAYYRQDPAGRVNRSCHAEE